jgi:hypothetical protein
MKDNDYYNEFGKNVLPLFREHYIIPEWDSLIDPEGFTLKAVPGRSYRIFNPQIAEEKIELAWGLCSQAHVEHQHMVGVRQACYDVINEHYLFIRGYRVGHTLEGETIVVVVEAQVCGGCHLIDERNDGRIGGDGKGRSYVVLCPSGAESELGADLKAEEAQRRELLPKVYYTAGFERDE